MTESVPTSESEPALEPGIVSGSLSVVKPEGWFHKESITLVERDGRANVIASTEVLEPSMTVEEYAGVQGDLLTSEFDGYEQQSYGEIGVAGLPAPVLYREFSWSPSEDGPPILQRQLYAVASGRGITATGTTQVDEDAVLGPMLFEIMISLVHHVATLKPGDPDATFA